MAVEQFNQFIELIAPWRDAYQDVSISYLGVKTGDKARLLQLRATFVVIGQTDPYSFRSKHVFGGRFSHRAVFGGAPIGTPETYLSRVLGTEFIGPGDVELEVPAANYHGRLWRHHPEGFPNGVD